MCLRAEASLCQHSAHVSVGWWVMMSTMIKVVITPCQGTDGTVVAVFFLKWHVFVWGGFANRWHLCVLLINTPSPNCLSVKMFCGTSVALCVCGLWAAACCLLLQRSECVRGWRTWATKHVWHLKLDNIPGRKTTEPCQTQRRQRYSCVADCDDNTHTHTHTRSRRHGDSYILIRS